MFIDTQVVSYATKGMWHEPLTGHRIVSIVANEFLLVQGQHPVRPNYYVPHPSRLKHVMMATGMEHDGGPSLLRRRSHPFGKRMTDSLMMEFGLQHPPIVEYGNFAMSSVINERLFSLFSAAVAFLEKEKRKLLIERFDFLCETAIQCVPVLRVDVETAFELLELFQQKHNTKERFRNTWNDILILAAARNRGEVLITRDNELSRFAAETYGSRFAPVTEFAFLDFSAASIEERRVSRESKGYVNSAWRVRTRNIGSHVF